MTLFCSLVLKAACWESCLDGRRRLTGSIYNCLYRFLLALFGHPNQWYRNTDRSYGALSFVQDRSAETDSPHYRFLPVQGISSPTDLFQIRQHRGTIDDCFLGSPEQATDTQQALHQFLGLKSDNGFSQRTAMRWQHPSQRVCDANIMQG